MTRVKFDVHANTFYPSATHIITCIFPASQAWHLYQTNRLLELVDSKLSKFNKEEVKRLIGVVLLCTQSLPSSTPSMSRLIAMLCGDIEVSTVNSKPGNLTEWTFADVASGDLFFVIIQLKEVMMVAITSL
ncbi:hypothetical protein Pint_17747 [Pistacia integerrima]|uniref:Uncharacterized protein n=1 Tax=Pistacia integerrima TaxID=434235 RepID=A0ACC0YTK2_9ROSI|nr:hypothetical protein Pint_17747 [Pistacia integerrima]